MLEDYQSFSLMGKGGFGCIYKVTKKSNFLE